MNDFKFMIEKRLVIAFICVLLILLGIYIMRNSYDFDYNLAFSSKYETDTIVGDIGTNLLIQRIDSYSNMYILAGAISLLSGLNGLINIFTKESK